LAEAGFHHLGKKIHKEKGGKNSTFFHLDRKKEVGKLR